MLNVATTRSPRTRLNPLFSGQPSSLINGLVAYWKMEEASGTRIDATGRGNDLTDNNTVAQGTGKVGNAAQMVKANSEYLSIASNSDFVGSDISFSFSHWFYIDSLPSSNNYLFGKGLFDFLCRVSSATQKVNFQCESAASPGSFAGAISPVVLSTTTWYHLYCGYDAGNDVVFVSVNNETLVTSALAGGVKTSVADFNIGIYNVLAILESWNGKIDEFGLWKRVLTAAERTALYNGGNGIAYPFSGT